MSIQLLEKYEQSAEKALNWLLQYLEEDGSYGSAINDLASYYKSPYLFQGKLKKQKAQEICYTNLFQFNPISNLVSIFALTIMMNSLLNILRRQKFLIKWARSHRIKPIL
jgi:hypothetical protein